jgi:hypothetical protein
MAVLVAQEDCASQARIAEEAGLHLVAANLHEEGPLAALRLRDVARQGGCLSCCSLPGMQVSATLLVFQVVGLLSRTMGLNRMAAVRFCLNSSQEAGTPALQRWQLLRQQHAAKPTFDFRVAGLSWACFMVLPWTVRVGWCVAKWALKASRSRR